MKRTLPTKTLLFAALFSNLQSSIVYGNAPEYSGLKEQAKGWMDQNPPLGFQENKGQMADSAGNLTSYVLFKAEVPNLNIWVTNTGLTYQFLKIEEEEKDETEREGGMKEDKIKGEWHRVDMVLQGASIKKENIITEGDITRGEINYYLAHCPDGIFNVKTYTKITIKNVYPGIDWMLYTSSNGGIKHDFIVQPNADPNQIKLIYEGSGNLNVKDNRIHFKNELGEVSEGELLCYQGSESNTVTSNYTVKKNTSPLYLGAGNSLSANETFTSLPFGKDKDGAVFSYEIGIALNTYDNTLPLIIDPKLWWATFYGGTGADGPMSIACDANGNVYITGYSNATNDFPVQTLAGSYNQGPNGGDVDAIIMRFNNSGARLWATYYGGSAWDQGNSITCDGANNVYITGYAASPNFPLQTLAGAYNQGASGGGTDAFILRFNNAGARIWATYYGGDGTDEGNSIACDGMDNVYVTGRTSSSNFPIQIWAGAYNQVASVGNAVFILRFDNAGVGIWATYYSGATGTHYGYSIACDGANNVYVTGSTTSTTFPLQPLAGAYNQPTNGGNYDAFILHFNNLGVRLWATYYGGTTADYGYSIACNAANNIYVAGKTSSANFPLQPLAGAYNQGVSGGSQDAFILRFDNLGVCLWATYYGGSSIDQFLTYDNLVIDACGNVYMSFTAFSSNLYTFGNTTCGNYYSTNAAGSIFYIKFNSVGAVVWATYFGGDGAEFREALAMDNAGNLFTTGEWLFSLNNATYPLTNPGGSTYFDGISNGADDGYIAKFIPPITYTQSQVNCSGSCDGSATVNLSCGTPPYSYVWSNGSSTLNSTTTTNTVTGLCAGNYTVTVTSDCKTLIATYIITCSTLPVELLSFTGHNEGAINKLHWQTATETNNDYVDVERSSDGKTFESIGQVKGAGNSSTIRKYEFIDSSPEGGGWEGALYYRLRQTDFDGKFTYSDIISLTTGNEQQTINIYPNPTSGKFTLVIANREERIGKQSQIKIYNVLGEKVFTSPLAPLSRGRGVGGEVDISSLPSGIYFLELKNETEKVYRKIIKE